MFRIIISGITATRHKTLADAEKKARALRNAEKKKYWLISDYAIFEELPDDQTARIFGFDNGRECIETSDPEQAARWAARALKPEIIRGRIVEWIC